MILRDGALVSGYLSDPASSRAPSTTPVARSSSSVPRSNGAGGDRDIETSFATLPA